MLRVEHLTKKYGKQVVLDDYILHIEQGSIACLVGENGAGKTTLIKCCCGGLHFQSGQIWLDGVSVKQDMIEYKRKLAYIPDNPELYEYMTGIEYLNYVCDVYKISEKVRRAEFDRYCEMLNIQDYVERRIATYSHGTKQKLMLLSSFMHTPLMIFMDEPLVGLDEKTVFQLKMVMREYCDRGGTILCSTHLYDKVIDVCDRKVTFP